MKRPLFCVAMAYALGEVVCLYTKTSGERSVVMAALCFVCIKLWQKKERKRMLLLLVGFVLGIIHTFFSVPDIFFDHEKTKVYEADTYQVSVYTGDGKQEKNNVTFTGIVSGKMGNDWVLRVNGSTDGRVFPRSILLRGMTSPCEIADRIQVSGEYRTFQTLHNPGEFSTLVYYQARKIEGYIYEPVVVAGNGEVYEHDADIEMLYYSLKRQLFAWRTELEGKLRQVLPEAYASLYEGILLGEKQGISNRVKTSYQIGGISHILAISGLHISILGGFVFRILRWLHIPLPASCLMALGFVWLYGVFSGMSLATMRAVLMFCIAYVAKIYGKHYDMPTSMGIALMLMLFANPVRILDAGMQLSYFAIAGVVYGNYLLHRFRKVAAVRRFQKKHRRLFALWTSVLYSVALNVMMFPVLADTYFEISAYGWLLNLFVIPSMTVVVVSGMAGMGLSFLNVGMAKVAFFPGCAVLKGYAWLCTLVETLPEPMLATGEISRLQFLLWYGGIALIMWFTTTKTRRRIQEWVYKKTGYFWRKKAVLVYYAAVVFFISVCTLGAEWGVANRQRREMVTFLDVGQGDCILLRSDGGCCMVIDGGSLSEMQCGTYTILPALKANGMTEIDMWFVTHTDADHISGLTELLQMGEVSQLTIHNVVISRYIEMDETTQQFLDLLEEAEINVYRMGEGECIYDATFTMTCLHPDSTYQPADKNAASLALAYHSNQMNLLFTGDMDADAVETMRTGSLYQASGRPSAIRYDCVKLPHHGSRNSYVEGLYQEADFGVISCGYENRYGHPHKEVLEGMEVSGMQILRTDYQGAIVFEGK